MNRVLNFYRILYSAENINYQSNIPFDEFKSRFDRVFHKESAFSGRNNIRLEYIGENEFSVKPIVEFAPIVIYGYFIKSKMKCRGRLENIDGNGHLTVAVSSSLAYKITMVLLCAFILFFIIFLAVVKKDWKGVAIVLGIGLVTITWFTYLVKVQCDEATEGMNKAIVLINKIS